jgi:hypothetical protein
MFNKTFQMRARRGGMVPVGEVLQDLVDAADERRASVDNRITDQPTSRHHIKKREPRQLPLLFHMEHNKNVISRDPDRPLEDLFPDFYHDRIS